MSKYTVAVTVWRGETVRKQEIYQTSYLPIALVRDNRKKHTFTNKVSMNRLTFYGRSN